MSSPIAWLLQSDKETAAQEAGSLVWVQYQRFAKRAEGVRASRQVPPARCTTVVCSVAADIGGKVSVLSPLSPVALNYASGPLTHTPSLVGKQLLHLSGFNAG